MNSLLNRNQKIIVERIDDLPLLIALQQKLGLAEIIDSVIPRHGLHQGLSIGQLVLGYNTFILSEADHRKVGVEAWANQHQAILSDLLGYPIRPTEFTDDRLSHVLSYLSDDTSWYQIEDGLWKNSVTVYDLSAERVRLDATRISGDHTPTKAGLMQFGYNQAKESHTQVKLMAASIDQGTEGHLVATSVVAGECADDPLYLPVIQRIQKTFCQPGLLYMGDSKMSAIEIRAKLAQAGDFYLVPLAKVGEVAKCYDQWVSELVLGDQCATLIYDTPKPDESSRLMAAGYQTTRQQHIKTNDGAKYTWHERVLVIRSFDKASKQIKALESRIAKATQALLVLTPQKGVGKRQIRTEDELHTQAKAILKTLDVADYLSYRFIKQQTVETRYVGRGRGGPNRKTRKIKTTRYQMTHVHVDEAKVHAAYQTMGFRIYATNQPDDVLPIDEAIRLYRAAPRIERHFHLFKDSPIRISPMYVRNDDQIKGLLRLVSLCVRLLTLIEIVVRRTLRDTNETLSGLYDGQPSRKTQTPTAKRLLSVFGSVDRIQLKPDRLQGYCVTELTPLQHKILSLLDIPESIYRFPKQSTSVFGSMKQRIADIQGKLTRWFFTASSP